MPTSFLSRKTGAPGSVVIVCPLVFRLMFVFLVYQLEDGHTLFDYSVGLNEIIQLLARKKPIVPPELSASAGNSSGTGEDNAMDSSGHASVEVSCPAPFGFMRCLGSSIKLCKSCISW